jgi:hypothetical protein
MEFYIKIDFPSKNQANFNHFTALSEIEQVDIIQTEFHLQAEGKISLKKYYQWLEEYTLFEWKGFKIKYETIRRTNLYQNFKK